MLDSIEDILDKIPEIPKERKVVETKEFNVKEIYNLIEKGISEKESIANKLKIEIKFLTDILFEMELNGQTHIASLLRFRKNFSKCSMISRMWNLRIHCIWNSKT